MNESLSYALAVVRKRLLLLVIAAAAISFLAGWAIALAHNVSDTAHRLRNVVISPHYDDEWRPFHQRLSRTASAAGLITDWFEHRDVSFRRGRRPFDIIAELRFGFPFRSHAYTIAREMESDVLILDGAGVPIGGGMLPLNIKVLGWAGNAVILLCVGVIGVGAAAWWSCSRRLRRGLCPRCRYDLSRLPDAPCCSECGRPISSAVH